MVSDVVGEAWRWVAVAPGLGRRCSPMRSVDSLSDASPPPFSLHTTLLSERFAAVIMRIREPKTTALIFASGKMVVTGAKSEDDSRLASRKYARILQKIGFETRFTEFKIQNIVGSCDVRFPIRLEGLAYGHGVYSSYEPELFPGEWRASCHGCSE